MLGNLFFIMSGGLLIAMAWLLWRIRIGRLLTRTAALGLILVAVPITGVNGYQQAMTYRAQPDPVADEVLFAGITYTRDVRSAPRPLVIHVVEIDLTHPDVQLAVTPPDDDVSAPYEIRARTTSEYLSESGAQLAINAGFFSGEGRLFSPLPTAGDPVDIVGIAAAQGEVYSDARRGFRGAYFSADNRVSIDAAPADGLYNAVAGYYWFLRDGLTWEPRYRGGAMLYYQLAPRTALAVDETGERLLFFVVDGRQPNYSEGVTISELTGIVREYGGHNALNLDGGGSSTLVVADGDGDTRLLNSPIHRNLPGMERPVGNHIAVFAAPATAQTAER